MVTLQVNHGGRPSPERTGLSAEDVATILGRLTDEDDTTVTISMEGTEETIHIAVSSGHAFVGLTSPDGVFQYVPHRCRSQGTYRFIIGGQPTDIEARYVTDLGSAAEAVGTWVRGIAFQSSDPWERR